MFISAHRQNAKNREEWGVHCKNIYKLLVILANLTNQMRVNVKIDTHFQGMRVLV